MAIQVRRGNYADLDISKLKQGEPFVTLDQYDGDYYVGMAIAPNNVVRLATWDDLTTIRQDCIDAKTDAETAESNAAISETNAGNSATLSQSYAVGGTSSRTGEDTDNSKYYSEQSGTYWQYVHDAVDMVVPTVTVNFTTGQLEITGTSLEFTINQTTGQLEWDIGHS